MGLVINESNLFLPCNSTRFNSNNYNFQPNANDKYDLLLLLQYFSIIKSDKQHEIKEDEAMEVNEINYFEDLMFDYVPKDEEEASIEMLIGNLNDQYPIPDDLMSLTLDLQNHLAPSTLPLVDHVINPPHVDPSSDHHVSLNDFE